MAAFTAQLKPFGLLIVCVTFIGTLAALAAGLQPTPAADVLTPAARSVPDAPAAALFLPPASSASALAALPQPAPVPAAPGAAVAEGQPSEGTAPDVPGTGSPLPLLALAVVGGLLAAGTLALRQTGPDLQPAAC